MRRDDDYIACGERGGTGEGSVVTYFKGRQIENGTPGVSDPISLRTELPECQTPKGCATLFIWELFEQVLRPVFCLLAVLA
jgi:hypothetical protein